jgi:GntR family transcriptional regulator, transcriptional repressor for pyruvate dehydrogenase complex
MSSTSLIAPVVVPKASDVLASRLRDLIISGQFSPGDFLPSERELVTESKLSRTSVRDALRVLESDGLISTKVGRTGGSMVTLPGRASVARSVELFVRTHGVRLESLLECRVAVEPTLARLAARHRTKAQLEEISSLHERFVTSVDEVTSYKRINLEWHLAVARTSGNEPLIALMEAISTPIRDAQDYQHVTTPELRAAAVKAHAAILKAIRDKDEEAAFKRMERHVTAYRDVATAKSAAA